MYVPKLISGDKYEVKQGDFVYAIEFSTEYEVSLKRYVILGSETGGIMTLGFVDPSGKQNTRKAYMNQVYKDPLPLITKIKSNQELMLNQIPKNITILVGLEENARSNQLVFADIPVQFADNDKEVI